MRKEALRQRDAMSDEELLGVCRAGDAEAFAALWERHRKAGLTAARNIAPTLDPVFRSRAKSWPRVLST